MPNSITCVDANLALRLVLPEEGRAVVREHWARWVEAGTEIVSPYLFAYETTSALRNKVARGIVTSERAEEALAELAAQQVRLLHPEGLEREAFALARELGRPNAYDCFYIALGKLLGSPTYTADERLYRAAAARAPWLRLVSAG